MTTFGITRIRDEVDVVEGTIRRMVAQVDHVIVGEGHSTDGTRELLEELARDLPVTIVDDTLKNYEQATVITSFAYYARDLGADWVIPWDADEAWMADEGRIKDRLATLPDEALLVHVANLTHSVTTEDDEDEADPMTRMGWRNTQQLPLGKVACRVRDGLAIGHGNHSATYDGVRDPLWVLGILQSRHFPYRSPDQFAKRVGIAWPMLRDSGLPRSHGSHMWEYGELLDQAGPDGLREFFRAQMTFDDPANDPHLVYDPLPPIGAFG